MSNTTDDNEQLASSALFGDWLPIETAPKDGTEVMGWSKRHGFHIGTVTPYKKPEMPKRHGGWFQPSHWTPLPSPPNIKDSQP
jgi:hypothetical protein